MVSALDSLARIAAERMVNSVVAGFVLTILAWSLLRLLPRINARTRVAVWLSVLVAIPGLSVAALFIGNTSADLASQSARIIVPEGWAFTIFIVWALLTTLALVRVVFGLWRIRSLRQACRPVNLADLDPCVLSIIEEFRPKRSVALLESETAPAPMAVGFFQAAVILPRWVLAELSASQISAILIHEFAHLRRWDDWTNFFQKLVRAVFFFHPSLWWVDRHLALDREIACDDAVIAATNKAHDYARCLVDLAEKSLVRRSLAMAQAAVHRVQHMSVRISQILDASRPRAARISKIALAGVTASAGFCLIAVLHSPTLIAFKDGSREIAASQPGPAIVATAASDFGTTAFFVPGKAQKTGSALVADAMMHKALNPAPHSLANANKVNRAATHTSSPAAVVPAKFTPRPKQAPKVLRAELSGGTQAIIPVESILVVMPDAGFDASGRVVWTLSVWRFTVFHPVQPPMEGTLPNSI